MNLRGFSYLFESSECPSFLVFSVVGSPDFGRLTWSFATELLDSDALCVSLASLFTGCFLSTISFTASSSLPSLLFTSKSSGFDLAFSSASFNSNSFAFSSSSCFFLSSTAFFCSSSCEDFWEHKVNHWTLRIYVRGTNAKLCNYNKRQWHLASNGCSNI